MQAETQAQPQTPWLAIARSQQRKIKNQEKEGQRAKINGKIVFSDLTNPPQIFTPLFGEVENGRTLTEK